MAPGIRSPEYYSDLEEKFEHYISGNELLEVRNTKTIFLLTTDVKTHNLIGVNRETMEGAIKSLNIGAKVLTRRSNAM